VELTAPTALPTSDLRAGFAALFEAVDFGKCATLTALLRLPNPAFVFGAGVPSLLRSAIAAFARALGLVFAVAFLAIGASCRKCRVIAENAQSRFQFRPGFF
jgi:hypothetical protein